jgi:hypothetical protein
MRFAKKLPPVFQFFQLAPLFAEMGQFGTPRSRYSRNGPPHPTLQKFSIIVLSMTSLLSFFVVFCFFVCHVEVAQPYK